MLFACGLNQFKKELSSSVLFNEGIFEKYS